MPKYWKVKRELDRIGQQARRAFFGLTGLRLGTYAYTFFHSHKVLETQGEAEIKAKAAIFLIYPSGGIASSHLLTLKYLISSGYAPVVVSNLALNAEDRAALCRYAAVVIERPNIGYDFGGYREGVLHIQKRRYNLEYLAFINDSCWFPLAPDCQWLQNAEAAPSDFVGAVFHEGIDTKASESGTFEWAIDKSRKLFHYGSFLILMKARTIESNAFSRFWAKYELSNNKKFAILHGEIALTTAMISAGFSNSALFDTTFLDRDLETLDDASLRNMVEDMVLLSYPNLERQQQNLLSLPNASREGMRSFILSAVATQGPAYALSLYASRMGAFDFLKKLPIKLSRSASIRIIDYLANSPNPYAATYHAEAVAMHEEKWGALASPDPRPEKETRGA